MQKPHQAWNMTLSEDFGAIIYICPLLSKLLSTANGLCPIRGHQTATTLYILHLVSSRTSLPGGRCSVEPCHFLFAKAVCGRVLKNPARSLADILLPSNTICCLHLFFSVTSTSTKMPRTTLKMSSQPLA